MTSRLYITTRPLFKEVMMHLTTIGLVACFSTTQFHIIALYLTGLILLDKRQNNCRISRWVPARSHDAINRLLRVVPFSTRMVMGLLITFAQGLGCMGYLCIDDVVVQKPFAQKIPWVGWAYSSTEGKPVRGLHIVVLLWCCWPFKVPVAFRLWRPKDKCSAEHYKTKLELAQAMVIEVMNSHLPFSYITFDIWYNARWFTKFLANCNIVWVSQLKSNTQVIYRKKKTAVEEVGKNLKLKWRSHLEVCAVAIRVYLPEFGVIRLVVTKDGQSRYEYLVTNRLDADLTWLVIAKRLRWDIEVLFRGTKQLAGLGACQCYVDRAMVRHVALVMLSYVVLQLLRTDISETVYSVKERQQLYAITGGMAPPPPLRARTI